MTSSLEHWRRLRHWRRLPGEQVRKTCTARERSYFFQSLSTRRQREQVFVLSMLYKITRYNTGLVPVKLPRLIPVAVYGRTRYIVTAVENLVVRIEYWILCLSVEVPSLNKLERIILNLCQSLPLTNPNLHWTVRQINSLILTCYDSVAQNSKMKYCRKFIFMIDEWQNLPNDHLFFLCGLAITTRTQALLPLFQSRRYFISSDVRIFSF